MLEHEYIKNAIEDDADMEIIDIKEKYETQLKECKDGNIKLKGEIGVLKRKIIAAHNEIDEYKEKLQKSKGGQNELELMIKVFNILIISENEEKLQEIIENLREDIGDLKKEILERELAIQLKEKTVQKLNVKNQELEKYKFVLSFKIEELKDQESINISSWYKIKIINSSDDFRLNRKIKK